MITSCIFSFLTALTAADPPVVIVDRDNIEITQSCTIKIAADPIPDTDNNGVIHITADNLTVDFAGTLRGARLDQPPDTFAGIGVKITAKNVTLKHANISGYKVGIHAINAHSLMIENCDVSNNFHQHLKSTPQAEDASDWLWPHANDNNEWMTKYGAGICVQLSSNVSVREVTAHHGQNGIILDRVDGSKVYDCDCSFLSGWGLAMWRSSGNIVYHNAFEFCVRGYSHGVYNRGQDSAGILMFEQCTNNVVLDNNLTHNGDGVFAFAGKESLGELNRRDDLDWYRARGCTGNIFCGNDCSSAVAHGLEVTFSFDNAILHNRFIDDAICGIWAGYSQRTRIEHNTFEANGAMGYGLEQGGINIEHGAHNQISGNLFRRNHCGVHLWWDDDSNLAALPWTKANGAQSADNMIAFNTFVDNDIAIRLRQTSTNKIFGNVMRDVGEEIHADGVNAIDDTEEVPDRLAAPIVILPIMVGFRPDRSDLSGREHIIMTEWGPWDHESPLLQFQRRFDHADEYRLLGVWGMPASEQIQFQGNVVVDVNGDRIFVRPRAKDTLLPYSFSFEVAGQGLRADGTLSGGTWEVWAFSSACDPREDVARWRREGTAEHHALTVDWLEFRFGNAGMSEACHLPVALPRNHFGVIATRSLTFPPGRWRIKTTSDDGIRVWMDDQLIIDDWTWHGPTRHDYEFALAHEKTVALRVEHFELDGYAILSFEIEKAE